MAYRYARETVQELFADYRKQVAGGSKPQLYTRAQHKAIRHMFTMLAGLIHVQHRALDKRIAELEARPELRHCGVWREKSYKAASFVTHAGGLWLLTKATKQRPGQSAAWTLVCKSGHAQ